MSTLALLPLLRVSDGVQTNEDWRLSIAFYLEDGVTPIPLTGLNFTLFVGNIGVLTTAGGQIVATGPSNNVLLILAPASAVGLWPQAVYTLTLTGSDGLMNRNLFVNSTLTVGGGQVASVTLVVAPDSFVNSVAAPLPGALATAFQALQPSQLASALAALPAATLSTLAQALFASLPVQTGPSEPVASGRAFVNNSGFVVIAQ